MGTTATTGNSGELAGWQGSPTQLLRVGPEFDLARFDRAATPGWSAGKTAAKAHMKARGKDLSDLQERLFADGKSGGSRSVLLLLQGMDTAGKGGIVRHVIGMVDPQGVALASFGVPTPVERAHHHLWRIERKLPVAGKIGVFDRSHYEQVLVVKVDELEPPDVNATRYAELTGFDQRVVASGTTMIKVALLVSHAEQGQRLAQRLQRPDKWWKYNPGDIDVRQRWDAYQDAYAQMLARTSTPQAPWFAIPADNKWYARLAITELLFDALSGLQLGWPPADFDVDVEKRRLAQTARS
ncbi:MAG: PPK2 family polyphosphate kinase [Beutenbergiaceae bacterium]